MKHYGILIGLIGVGLLGAACGGEGREGRPPGGTGSGGSSSTGAGGTGISGTGGILGDAGPGGNTGGDDDNPTTCSQAAQNRTYIGCDFWPTVTFNPVYVDFDFNVVIANGGTADANITVERGGSQVATAMVPAGGLAAVPLPWVMELKGEEFMRTEGNEGARRHASVLVSGGAYHLTSDIPVTVWQFSPLEYQQAAANCPGIPADSTACLSVSNDASLLLPSTAMTNNYRLFGRSAKNEGGGETWGSAQGAFAITAPHNDTAVSIQLTDQRQAEVGMGAQIGAAILSAGTGVTAAMPGETISYTLQAGDVLQLVGEWGPFEPEPHGDLSGSIVNATQPVQIIALNPLLNGVPTLTDGNPDHIEETVLPAEVIGRRYIVAPPTGPDAGVPGHMVRFYGNAGTTTLTYTGTTPAGAPTTLAEGEVVEIGPVTDSFIVSGDQPFTVASIMLGGTVQDSSNGGLRGDPGLSMMVAPDQFRTQYTFLAPTTYLQNYADILVPDGATVTLDGAPLSGPSTAIADGWSVVRQPIANGDNNGAHRLESDQAVGLQVMGFGLATSYYVPGGLNLNLISEPPIIK